MKNMLTKIALNKLSTLSYATALLLSLGVSSCVFADAEKTADKADSAQTQATSTQVKVQNLSPNEDQVITSLNIFEILRRHHYLKLPLNAERSGIVFDAYFKSLDSQRSFFIQSDIDEFAPLRTQFFQLLRYGQLKQGYTIYKRYLERIKERNNFLIAKLKTGINTIDLNTNDTLLIDREKAPWPKDQAEQRDLWSKQLTDDVLRLKLSNKKDDEISSLLTKRYENQLKRLQQISSEDIFQNYVNAFAMSYDPHTEYMSPETAENFDINMSLSLEGIGAVLQNDNDYVKIVRLVPAGPAAKSKQIAPADRIVSVGQENGEMVDVVGLRLEDVVKKIRGPKGSKVALDIIPASNPPGDLTTKKVTLIREAIKLEDQAAKKSILTIDNNGKSQKVGVIELPTFYLDFKGAKNNNPNYRSSVRDVKKLLSELQKEKVDGIIIDLRSNGGGSLQEATDLVGLFLPSGPAVQVRDSNGEIAVLDDISIANKEAQKFQKPVYTGPLIIVVNRLSASASEIFAGAMQDYHRALIVGGQTFGKGTVQSVLPLKHGEIKLTVAKFYRVSGQSTQNKGVIPDISYPSIIDTEQLGESSLPQAMPWDTIPSAIGNLNNPYASKLTSLQKNHDNRVQTNPDFVYYEKRAALVKKLSEEKTLSLNLEKRKQQKEQSEKDLLALENAKRTDKGDKSIEKLEDLEKEINKELENNETPKPEKDGYLVETAHILLDSVNQAK